MAVLTVANLKGGVGKSTTAVHLAHTLSRRFCETLLIDLDPQGDSTALLQPKSENINESPSTKVQSENDSDLMSRFIAHCNSSIITSRDSLSLLPLGALCSSFANLSLETLAEHGDLLPALIEQLSYQYDYVVIDTPPTWSAIHQAALSSSSLTIIPVDQSEMSVRAAISFLKNASEDQAIAALLLRTMINRRARRIDRVTLRKMTEAFIPENHLEDLEEKYKAPKKVGMKGISNERASIYLSESSISRSEKMHLLTYQKKTAFESKDFPLQQQEYNHLAKDVEHLLATISPEQEEEDAFDFAESF